MGILLRPFSWLLLFFYRFAGYGIALILFALVIKLILFPVTLKSKKSMIQMNMLSGKMQQLQKQYGKDRDRYNQEVQKLYEREKVNPMGGCLWSLIPLFLLIALLSIIREPLTNFMGLTVDQIGLLADELNWSTVAVANGWVSQGTMDTLLGQVSSGEIQYVFQNGSYNQLYLLSLINEGNLASLQAALGDAGSNLFIMDFTFLGLNLASIPNWRFWSGGVTLESFGLFLLPLISTAISFLSMKVSMATNKLSRQQSQANSQVESTNRMMMIMMPLMSLWIGFTVPAGLSIYWIAQYVVNMVQEVICARLLRKDYEAAQKAAEERERREKEEEKRRKEEARLERARRIEEEKKNRGKKKPGQKKKDEEPDQDGVNKADSREGIRAYARGRAYIPNRFGGVTPYCDPDEQIRAAMAAQEASKGKKKKKAEKTEQEKPEQVPAVETAEQTPLPEADQQTAAAPLTEGEALSREPEELESAEAAEPGEAEGEEAAEPEEEEADSVDEAEEEDKEV